MGHGNAPPPVPGTQSRAALPAPQLGHSPVTCSYHHSIVLRLQASLGSPVSSPPSRAGRSTQGPAETWAPCSHSCPAPGQEFASSQLLCCPGRGRGRANRKRGGAAVQLLYLALGHEDRQLAESTRDRVSGGRQVTRHKSGPPQAAEDSHCAGHSRAPTCETLCPRGPQNPHFKDEGH